MLDRTWVLDEWHQAASPGAAGLDTDLRWQRVSQASFSTCCKQRSRCRKDREGTPSTLWKRTSRARPVRSRSERRELRRSAEQAPAGEGFLWGTDKRRRPSARPFYEVNLPAMLGMKAGLWCWQALHHWAAAIPRWCTFKQYFGTVNLFLVKLNLK